MQTFGNIPTIAEANLIYSTILHMDPSYITRELQDTTIQQLDRLNMGLQPFIAASFTLAKLTAQAPVDFDQAVLLTRTNIIDFEPKMQSLLEAARYRTDCVGIPIGNFMQVVWQTLYRFYCVYHHMYITALMEIDTICRAIGFNTYVATVHKVDISAVGTAMVHIGCYS